MDRRIRYTKKIIKETFLNLLEEKELNVFLILKKEKYESFSIEDRELVEHNPKLMIENIRIKNPDNPANLMDAKLIVYKIMV